MVTPSIRLVRALGEGGMGRVWLADHTALHTHVVVKFMAADLEKSGDAAARFSREAKAASQVKSPHVVQMLDYGVMDQGVPYIVMELLEGRDLGEQIAKSGALSAADAAGIVAQLARALSKAHERGIVHRDIKPSNIFLCDVGGGETFVKLLDFGIAKSSDMRIEGSTTRTGSVMGSPFYMSPEQVIGSKEIDFRSDLWSVGVVVYEMITGEKPFMADTVGALALKIHRDPIPRARATVPALPEAVDAYFDKALAREPAARFASVRELAETFALVATGAALPPGLAVDSKPTRSAPPPVSATASTLQVEGPPTMMLDGVSGVDTRTSTAMTMKTPMARSPRGALVAAAAGLLLVVGGVALAGRLRQDGHTTLPVPSTTEAAPSNARVMPPPPPTDATRTALSAEAPAPTTNAAASAAPAARPGTRGPASAGRGQAKAAGGPPVASATPSAATSAAPLPPPIPAHGSEDDIK